MDHLLKATIVLIVLVFVIYFVLKLAKFVMANFPNGAMNKDRQIIVDEQHMISARERVALIRCGMRKYLVWYGSAQPVLLDKWDS